MKGEQGEKLIRQRVEHMERMNDAQGIDMERLWKQLHPKQQPAMVRKPWLTLWAAAMLLVAAGVGTWLLTTRAEPDRVSTTVMSDKLSELNMPPADMMQTNTQDADEDMEYDQEDDATAGLYAAPEALMANDATVDPQLIYN
jgi:hypothetical protein